MAAIPDQNIANYWKNWTAAGGQSSGHSIWSDMQQYGVTPFDIARATGSNLDNVFQSLTGRGTTEQQGEGTNYNDPSKTFYFGNKAYIPEMTGGMVDQGDGQVWTGPQTTQAYNVYDYHPEWDSDVTKYNGQPYQTYDNNGNYLHNGVLSGFENNTWLDNAIPFITAAIATYGASAVAGAAGAGAEASGGGLSAGGGTGLTTGGGLTGTGLNVAPGAGLNLAQTTSSLSGLSPTIGGDALLNGAGLTTGLTGAGTGLGLDAATAGNAILDEAGLTGGLANATGSLLPPSITDGSYQMADGTIVPNMTSTGVPVIPPATTPSPTTSIPKAPIPTGSGGGNNGLGLNDWAKLLAGGVDWYKQQQAGNGLLDYLKAQQAKIDNLYSQGSPELQLMQQTLDRKDAAAGRMSQYGTRATDLAGRIAQIKADATTRMTTGIGALYKAGLDQKASAPAGLMSALSRSGGLENVLKSLGVPLNNVIDFLKNNYGMSGDMATEYLSGLSDPSVYNVAQDAAFNDSNPDLNGSIYDYLGDN